MGGSDNKREKDEGGRIKDYRLKIILNLKSMKMNEYNDAIQRLL